MTLRQLLALPLSLWLALEAPSQALAANLGSAAGKSGGGRPVAVAVPANGPLKDLGTAGFRQNAALGSTLYKADSIRPSLVRTRDAQPAPTALSVHPALLPAEAPAEISADPAGALAAQVVSPEASAEHEAGRVPAAAELGEGVVSQGVFEHAARSAPSRERGLLAGPKGFAALKRRVEAFVARDWALPVSEIFREADVLLLGESHRSLSSLRALTENLPRLKAAGVATVGLEGLKKPQQEAVDAYLRGESESLPEEALGFSPGRRSELSGFFAAARREGLRVTALGRPLDEWAREVAALAARAAGESPESFGRELGAQADRAAAGYESGFNESVAEVLYRRRNQDMAETLAAGLGAGEKAVALVGDSHLELPPELVYRLYWLKVADYGHLAVELKAKLLRSFSLALTGGLFILPEDGEGDSRLRGPLYRLVAETVPSGGPAFLRSSAETGVFHLGGRSVRGSPRAHAASLSLDGKPETPVARKNAGAFYGFIAGGVLAVFAPVFWGAAPIHVTLLTGSAVALPVLLIALALIPVAAYRSLRDWLRRRRGETAPVQKRRFTLRRALAGIALGAALAGSTFALLGPLTPALHRVIDKDAIEQAVTPLPGEFRGAVIAHLSEDAAGRALLENFRDRGGRLALPKFFNASRGNSEFMTMTDAVFISGERRPEQSWKDYVRQESTTIFHELTHATQARRLGTPDIFHNAAYENEAEAYIGQAVYLYERWKRDPGADDGDSRQTIELEMFAENGLDAYVAMMLGQYGEVGHLPPEHPYYAWYAAFKAGPYPRISVDALILAGDRYRLHHNHASPHLALKVYTKALARARHYALGDFEAVALERISVAQREIAEFEARRNAAGR